ncbi:uncharacterized protein J4E78_006775 [Alternaria triticimaculans]|uniref:uncharacterized protein n=1 Tax=Alternaria triticimaculans TaxID=297637 RepID=UPI0020C55D25|nr:uncharacterized protein J4E78_006775 [Alternaria triticimaculans]KAI4656884.1 hypothetical protein J4E78_006775 [Alternaria triticimaculans]
MVAARRDDRNAKSYNLSCNNLTGGPPGFVTVGNNNRNNNANAPAPQRAPNAPNQAPPARGPGVQGQGHGNPQPPPPPPPQQQQQQQQQQPDFHQMPAMNNARGPQPGEADPHLQPGGQTEFDERPLGQGRSEDADAEPAAPDGGRGGDAKKKIMMMTQGEVKME